MHRRRYVVPLLISTALMAGSGAQALAAPLGPEPATTTTAAPAPAPAPAPRGKPVSGPTKIVEQDRPGRQQRAERLEPLTPPATTAPKALRTTAAAADCRVSDFTGNTGTALVDAIKAASVGCINSLFSVTGSDQYHAFREAQMVTVAGALRTNAASYNGTNAASTEQLVLYLRAGYYVHYYNPDTVGPYTGTLTTATRQALDTFYANPATRTVSDANGEILGEAVILIDSAEENARYLYVVKRLLAAYDSAHNANWYMRNAVNNVFTVLFRGEWAAGYPAAVQADPSIVDAVYTFAAQHLDLLSTDSAFLVANAGGETARFVQYAALQNKVRPLSKWLLDNSAITGDRAKLWVRVAVVANSKDAANCSAYGTCDLEKQLKAAVLPQNHTCSAGVLHILAQKMTDDEFQAACSSLLRQNSYFHDVVKDGGRPVADDNNSTMEVVAFKSRDDYQTYAGAIYGIDTNNGGMYLEGDPSATGNQPRFIAYQWDTDNGFAARIWNLNHEYTHYLDGRYDMYGDFNAGQTHPAVWWIEGAAEYVSYSYRNLPYDAALKEAPKHTYALSTLFDTTYANTTTDRTYHWGYLAARYMLEKHPADVTRLLGYYRTGKYADAYRFTKSLNYDGAFNAWLDTLSGGGTTECTASDTRVLGQNCGRSNVSATTGNTAHFYIWIPSGTTSLTIKASGGTGNADLYFNPDTWATPSAHTARSTGPDNTESLTVTGLRPGAYHYISLHATTSFTGATVSTSY
ncbi:M9 family metallopeptidase [Streptomyces sp. NPDC059009]|uniref:M9 family metallopeptidase n=1 Tax=Streptomyces sp. NPDC059009 TaxID=3346694 RepID=UPI0036752EC8